MEENLASKSQRTSAVLVGMSTAFITSFFGSALNLSIPDMGVYFHMGAASVGWLITAYSLIIAAFSVPFGKLADSTSRRTVLIVGTSVFGAASLAAVFSPNAVVILSIRVIQALGAAMIFATNMPIAISVFPGKERGKAIGMVTSGTYSGLALGPVLGGILNTYFGWKSIFIFGTLVSVFALIINLKGLEKDHLESKPAKQDITGNIFYILMIASIIYGLSSLNSLRFGWAFILIGIALGVLFARTELKAENPVIDVRIFRGDRTYTLSNITALFNYSATFALGYLVSIYLQVVLGLSSQTAGFILISQPFFMAVLSPKMGKMSDRVAPYKLASAGMGLCALSLLFFAFIHARTPVWMIVIALSVAGIGISLFSSPNTNVIMSCVPPAKFGVANSILTTMRTTGQSSGMAIIMLVVSGTVGNISLYDIDSGDLVRTVHIAFIIFTVLCAAGIFMSLQRKRS
ncbi:MFS transporter [bacterium 210820-DFI.6.37]|nr:MFS transporter [bacterium 210820-DFI.6.37]